MAAKRVCLCRTTRLADLSRLHTRLTLASRHFDGTDSRPASSATSWPGIPTSYSAAAAATIDKSVRGNALAQTAKQFIQAVERGAISTIRRLYPRLVATVVSKSGETAHLETIIERRALYRALRLLSESSAHSGIDYELMWRIFEDMQRVFLVKPNLEECACIIAGMVASGRLREAYEWLKALPAIYQVQPTVNEWNLVLQGIERNLREAADRTDGIVSSSTEKDASASVALLQAVYNDMLDSGLQPNVVSYNTLLRVFALNGDLAQLKSGLDDMRHRGLAPDAQTHAILLRGCIAVGDLEGARTASKALLSPSVEEAVDVDAWNSLLLLASVPAHLRQRSTHGSNDGVEPIQPADVIKLMQERGAEPNSATLVELIRADTRPLADLTLAGQVIDRAEEMTGLTVDADALGLICRRIMASPSSDGAARCAAALAIYEEAVHGSRAVVPSNGLVLPIIQGLAAFSLGESKDLAIAQRLYADLQSAADNNVGITPSVEVYRALFQLCGKNPTGSQWAEKLLGDMKRYKLELSMDAVIQHAGPIMRISPDYDAAARILLGFHHLNPRKATTASAETLLQLFLSIPIADAPAPYERTTQIVQQMRFVSAFFGTAGYCALFRHYGGENASGKADALAIQRFHTVLSLDRFYDPETSVFNQLIRAYAAAGAYDAAWSVWESMLLSPQRALWDRDTIASVLDLCGAAVGGAVLDPRPVWRLARTREAVDGHFILGKEVWDAWVGALSRIGSAGQLDYASDVVTGQMGRAEAFREPLEGADLFARAHIPPAADAATLDILLRYAHAKGGNSLLVWQRKRLQDQLPDLWPLVVDVERFEWDEVRRLREQCKWPDYGDEPWHGSQISVE